MRSGRSILRCARDLVVGPAPVEAGLAVAAIELHAIDDRLALVPARAALVFTLACRPEHRGFAIHHPVTQNLAVARSHEYERPVGQRIGAGKPCVRGLRPRARVRDRADDCGQHYDAEQDLLPHVRFLVGGDLTLDACAALTVA